MAGKLFDIILIGPFPETSEMIRFDIQSRVWSLAMALKRQPEITHILSISLPLAVTRKKAVQKTPVDDLEIIQLTAPYRFLASSIVHFARVLRLIKERPESLVHIHGAGLLQTALCIYLRLTHRPFVLTLHGLAEKETYRRYRQNKTWGNAARYTVYTFLERIAIAAARNICTDVPLAENDLRAKYPLNIVPQGIFAEKYHSAPAVEAHAPIILAFGPISPAGGQYLTLKAFAGLKDILPHTKLIIAGTLISADYLESLKLLAVKLGVREQTEFLPDAPQSDMIMQLSQARAMVSQSAGELPDFTLYEALAAGVPVIAPSAASAMSIITDGENGYLTDYGNSAAFAESLARVLIDDALFAHMSLAARMSAAPHDWKIVMPKLLDIYEQARNGAQLRESSDKQPCV